MDYRQISSMIDGWKEERLIKQIAPLCFKFLDGKIYGCAAYDICPMNKN